MPILFTPGQLRDALGLTKETYRYWRKDLPALNRALVQKPRFGPSDLLATAIVKSATEAAGVPVSKFAPVADRLFSLCRGSAWPQLEWMAAVFLWDINDVRFVPVDSQIADLGVALIVPLRPVVGALREQLHLTEQDVQANLAFPPFALHQGAGR